MAIAFRQLVTASVTSGVPATVFLPAAPLNGSSLIAVTACIGTASVSEISHHDTAWQLLYENDGLVDADENAADAVRVQIWGAFNVQDAIDQIQVSLAPFDIREGGFTGAGVNAVTKSGSNEISGTAYYFFRNENFIGKKVDDVEVPNLDFATNLYGATIGGPIIKNKLFFFVSAEAERRNELAHGWIADDGSNTGQANVSTVLESDISAVRDRYLNYWNYFHRKVL